MSWCWMCGSPDDNRAAAALMSRLRASLNRPGPLAGLTAQERTLLGLIGDGLTNRQIAEHMFLPEKTVKNYVSPAVHQARAGATHPDRRAGQRGAAHRA
jgi:DNA-binding NarL/FixJ family response regulator